MMQVSVPRWCWLPLLLPAFCVPGHAAGSRPLMGKKAPEFHIQGIYQEPYSLETFKGHILVMQFGASW
jgi:hypothetical protein